VGSPDREVFADRAWRYPEALAQSDLREPELPDDPRQILAPVFRDFHRALLIDGLLRDLSYHHGSQY
jgi:hypothetical protein